MAKTSLVRRFSYGLLIAGVLGVALAGCYTIYQSTSCTGACCGNACPPHGFDDHQDPVQDLYTVSANTTPNAFYVLVANGDCPDIVDGARGKWVGNVLLPYDASGKVYCGYTWHSDDLQPPNATLISRRTDNSVPAPEVDEPALSYMAPPMTPQPASIAWLEPMHQQTRERLGMLPLQERPAQRGRVRVAVIDSASGDFYGSYKDPVGHGRAVGKLVDELACDNVAQCKVEIRNYPALTLVTNDKHKLGASASGAGAYGTRAQLAYQIERATRDWLADRSSGVEHLVINLSVGWSSCWDSGGDTLALESRAVRAAIMRASCHGVLVVAAGGNRDAIPNCPAGSPGAGKPGQHVRPGLWANDGERPSADTCNKQYLVSGAKDDTLGPLLLGVSAVDELDGQLTTAAQDASLVAYGNTVVVPDDTKSQYTNQFAGTSMSAAAVSGIAAAVWSAYPERTPRQLENDLIEPAIELRARNDGGNFICDHLPVDLKPSTCRVVRRASLCASLAHAGGSSSDCGPAANPSELTTFSVPLAMPELSVGEAQDCAACAGSTTAMCAACKAPDPSVIDSAEQPWAVGPQPDGASCGACLINRTRATFEASFKSGWWQSMSDAVITFPDGTAYTIHAGALTTANYSVAIKKDLASVKAATLSYRKPETPDSPIYVMFTEPLKFGKNGIAQ